MKKSNKKKPQPYTLPSACVLLVNLVYKQLWIIQNAYQGQADQHDSTR